MAENFQVQSEYQNTYFSLIEKVGSAGRYQTILAIGIIIEWFIIGAILLGPTLLFANSNPQCPSNIEGDCYEYVCSLDESQWSNYYPKKVDSIRFSFGNLFICKYEWIITLLESLVYLGNFFSNIVYGLFTDNFGRKFTFILSWGTCCLGLILISISWHISVVAIGLFLVGLGTDQTCNVTFILLTEQIENRLRQKYSVAVQLSWPLGGFAIAAIFNMIPHWRLLVIITFLIPALFAFCLIYFIQQTPRFTIKKGIDKVIKSLGRIAKINGLKDNPITYEDVERILKKEQILNSRKQNGYQMSLWDICRYKSLLLPTIFLGLIQTFINLIYFGQVFMIDEIGLNSFVNQALLNGSQILSIIISFLLILNIPRRLSGLVTFGIIGVLSIILILIKDDVCQLCAMQYLKLVLIAIARLLLCLWITIYNVYVNQLFPQSARGIGWGVSGAIGTIGSIFCPLLIQVFISKNHDPMIVFAMVSFITMACLLPLKQTYNKKLREEIEQLEENLLQVFPNHPLELKQIV